ncbi:MAG: hypothetical protein H0V33_03835 [Acidimicrobiia bacterium]|jgi:hypothetical protein|nr:hypothetical protein [Acidimicrobiia bacterium]
MGVVGMGALVAASVAGCSGGGDEGEEAAAGDAPGAATTAVEQPTSTTTAAAAPTTVVSAPRPAPTPTVVVDDDARFSRPGDAAAHLYQAWRDGDPDSAAVAADADAVDTLFARSWRQPGFTGSECTEESSDTHRCFMDGEGESLVFGVTGTSRSGYRVTSASFVAHPATADGAPSLVVSPARAAVGATVSVEGDGFLGDPWNATDAPLYLVGGGDGCALHAVADADVQIDGDGHLVGDFVVPAIGDCRMSEIQAPVAPGRYQLAYACTACFVGEIEVIG